jgi:hypothetical protein
MVGWQRQKESCISWCFSVAESLQEYAIERRFVLELLDTFRFKGSIDEESSKRGDLKSEL